MEDGTAHTQASTIKILSYFCDDLNEWEWLYAIIGIYPVISWASNLLDNKKSLSDSYISMNQYPISKWRNLMQRQ